MHILHDWHIDMTHDEVISTCTICGKIKREPWHPILGWCRPPQVPPPKRDYKDKVSVIDNSWHTQMSRLISCEDSKKGIPKRMAD